MDNNQLEPTGYVYRITNKITGEIYIGQHKTYGEPWRRYMGSSTLLREAMKMYGEGSFTKAFLCWCWSREELNTTELLLMRQHRDDGYKMYNRNFGSPSFPIANTWEHMDEITRAEAMERRSQGVIASKAQHYASIMEPLREEIIAHYLESGQLLSTAKNFNLPRRRVREFLLANGVLLNARNVRGYKVSEGSRRRISRGVKEHGKSMIAPLVELRCCTCGFEFQRRVSATLSARHYCSDSCRVAGGRSSIYSATAGELDELYHGQGFSIAEMGKKYACGKSTVYARLKELGIPRKRERSPH